jgi:hypothetical protein
LAHAVICTARAAISASLPLGYDQADAHGLGGGHVAFCDTDLQRDRPIFADHRLREALAYPFRIFAELGGLLSYGVDLTDNFRRAATYADRILNGTKPSELPVQTPVSTK